MHHPTFSTCFTLFTLLFQSYPHPASAAIPAAAETATEDQQADIIAENTMDPALEPKKFKIDELLALLPGSRLVAPNQASVFTSESMENYPLDMHVSRTLCKIIEFENYMPQGFVLIAFGGKMPEHETLSFGLFREDARKNNFVSDPLLAITLSPVATATPSFPIIVSYSSAAGEQRIDIASHVPVTPYTSWAINLFTVPDGFFVNIWHHNNTDQENPIPLTYSQKIEIPTDMIKYIVRSAGIKDLYGRTYVSQISQVKNVEENLCLTDD